MEAVLDAPESILEQPKANPRPTLQTRLTFEREYIQGKGTIEAIAQRLSVSVGTANDWYYQSGLKQKRLAYAERVRQSLCAPEQEPIKPIAEPVTNSNAKLAIVEAEIERLSEQLKTDLKPQVRAALIGSLDKLLEYVLPKSGRTKSRSVKERRQATDQPEPLPATLPSVTAPIQDPLEPNG